MKSDSLVDWVLRNERSIRHEVAMKRADVSYYGSSAGGGSHGSGISRPTERIAMNLAEEIKVICVSSGKAGAGFRLSKPERWIRVIDTIKRRYNGTMQGELIEYHYKDGLGAQDIADRLKISRAMFFVMKNDIISFGEGVATGVGLWIEK